MTAVKQTVTATTAAAAAEAMHPCINKSSKAVTLTDLPALAIETIAEFMSVDFKSIGNIASSHPKLW